MKINRFKYKVVLCMLLIMLTLCSCACAEVYPVGSIVEFGRYEQDGNIANGPEPIEWIVLAYAKEETTEYELLSRYILDYRPYETSEYQLNVADFAWYSSQLYLWLNSDFMNEAFTKQEQELLIPSRIPSRERSVHLLESKKELTVFLGLYAELEEALKTMPDLAEDESIIKMVPNLQEVIENSIKLAWPTKACRNDLGKQPGFYWTKDAEVITPEFETLTYEDIGLSKTEWSYEKSGIRPVIFVSLEDPKKVCPSCLWETDMMDAVFCMQCGTKF